MNTDSIMIVALAAAVNVFGILLLLVGSRRIRWPIAMEPGRMRRWLFWARVAGRFMIASSALVAIGAVALSLIGYT